MWEQKLSVYPKIKLSKDCVFPIFFLFLRQILSLSNNIFKVLKINIL